MMIPFFVTTGVLAGSIAMLVIRKHFSGLLHFNWLRFFYDRSVPLLVLFAVAMYSFLVNTAVSPFKCNYVGNFMMYDNPSASCFDNEWRSHLPQVIFFFILYPLGLPGAMIYLFYKNKQNTESEEFRASFGSITNPYKDTWFWWELMQIFRRTSFAVVNAFIKMLSTEDTSLFFTSCLLFTFMILEISYNPYKKHVHLLSSITLTVVELLFLVTNGVIFQNDRISQGKKEMYGFIMVAILVVIIGTTGVKVLRNLYDNWLERKGNSAATATAETTHFQLQTSDTNANVDTRDEFDHPSLQAQRFSVSTNDRLERQLMMARLSTSQHSLAAPNSRYSSVRIITNTSQT
eukprot:TRINITY_DN7344_c0_g3_i3.p1 TRINITY_DN7344_c0_g3~~TRINITY_DN7344_c0_g3_i3.p1  ORF type:complete len:347 (-),score=62.98 TRINITY_DN7344_c0_g3_i3:57-1097(-)